MKKFRPAFCLCLLLSMPVANADELSFFGLADVQPMSDTAGESVRGAGGVTARTTGSAGLTATVLDPDTGSIWNFNVTQFSDTRDIKNHLYEARSEHSRSNAFSDLMIGIGDLDIALGDFRFQMIGSAARATARANAGDLADYLFQ